MHSLIGLYCTEHPAEEQIASWFSGVSFEALRPEVSCLAAAVSAAQDYRGVPKELIPRLRGIMKYVHTLNSGMAAGLLSLGKQCNCAQLPITLLGGTAIHFSDPNPPRRHIWRMEIGVTDEGFPRILELAKNAGFAVEQTPYTATARCGNTQCIFIRKGMDAAQAAGSLTLGGVAFSIPDKVQLLVSLAQTGFEALMASDAKLLPWLMDFHCLAQSKPDWTAVAALAQKRGASAQVQLMLELYCALVPNEAIAAAAPLLGSEMQALRMARLLLNYRRCRPHTLKHRWLSAQIRNNASPLATLWHIIARKLVRNK